MARRALAASFVLAPLGALFVAQGCTQDFSAFDPTGSGGSGATTTTTTGSPTSSSSTTTSSTSSVGPGGGEGGSTSSGGGQGGVGGTGTGGSGPCELPSDCDDNNDCTTDGCVDTVCSNTPVADGPVGGTDSPTDCRNRDCVAGALVDEADDTEDPGPDPVCKISSCQAGAPVETNVDDGTSCGPAPQECAAGVCVGCDPDPPDTEAECGPDQVCAAPICVEPGICDEGLIDAGTPVADPMNGDCQTLECDGLSGNPAVIDDDTDTPADLPCAARGCNNGSVTTNTLADGVACRAGEVGFCDGGGTAATNCRTCRDTVAGGGTDPGCSAATPICDEAANAGEGQCRECQDTSAGMGTDLGCPMNEVCDPAGVGNCVDCYTDTGVAVNCAVNEVCDPAGNGACVTCYDLGAGVTDAGCMLPDKACDEGADQCEECQDNSDCTTNADGHLCNQSGGTVCGCQNDGDCTGSPQGEDCQGMTSCGCTGGVGSPDCDHAGSLGPNCVSNVCAP